MTEEIILPKPGAALRTLITVSGYRPFLEEKGLDKNLDDMAAEKRSGSNFQLLLECQEQWLRAIQADCGLDWARFAEASWGAHSKLLRSFAQITDTTGMVTARADAAVLQLLVIPELSEFIRRASRELPFLDVQNWWQVPLMAWLQQVERQSGLSQPQLLECLCNHLDIDQKTLERWQQGEPVGVKLWPYRETVQALIAGCQLATRDIDRITGWLVMAVALQSLSAELRGRLQQDFDQQGPHSIKRVEEVCMRLKQEAADRSQLPLRERLAPVFMQLHELFADARGNEQEILARLNWLRPEQQRCSQSERVSYEHLWLGLSARFAANLGQQQNALDLYTTACEKSWWRAGENQHALLHEALCYAVGVGDKVKTKYFWDKCYLLGLNDPPFKDLDEQNQRRLSFEFERLFAPQKAKQRIPPAMRFNDKPFSLSAKELKDPNRKRAQAEGRVRYTLLMDAVLQGTLEDVKQVVEAGGDPNVIIPESGENALIMALRRAWDRKDPEIVQYLLTLDIKPETVNQPASTKRETLLHIAMNMADAGIVERLIELGADAEQACFTSPSALIYAMALLYDSVHGYQEQLRGYLEGRVPADAFDAKGGAVLDAELAALRQKLYALRDDPRREMIFEAVMQYFMRGADEHRAVVMTLLAKGANPNRRYPDFNGYRDLWTPTLQAAQLGDLEVMKAMIAAGGDPWALLEEDDPSSEKDALWVALAYKRQAVVEHLRTLLPGRT